MRLTAYVLAARLETVATLELAEEDAAAERIEAVIETVAEDEAIVEISTDKVDSEIPSPVSGTITTAATAASGSPT